LGAYELNQEVGSTSEYVYILLCDKTRVQMIYFNSKTARPIVVTAIYYHIKTLFVSFFLHKRKSRPGFEFRLAYSQNASNICKLRVTFIQALKILQVSISRQHNVKTKLE